MDRIDLLADLSRQAAAVAARQIALLAEIAREDDSPDEWASLEVSAVLHIAPATAANRMHIATTLAGPLARTLGALSRGEITERHALILAAAVIGLTEPVARAVEERTLANAADQTPGRFAATVRRAVLRLDPGGEEVKHLAALGERRVVIRPDDRGMAELWALLPAEGAATLKTAMDAVADELREGHPDERTADQLRADALVTLADAVLGDPALLRHRGRAPTVQVTVSASTLLGGDDQPGELAGYGPISARQARRIAADAKAAWRILLVDDDGLLHAQSRRTYRPSAMLAHFVTARDRHCTFPGCARPAASCDLDHVTAFADGGETVRANLHALCRRHHRAKHHARWRPTRDQDGTTTWLSPTGHTYHSIPPPLPTDIPPPLPIDASLDSRSEISAGAMPRPSGAVGQLRDLVDHHTQAGTIVRSRFP
jgi:uncharacterized protein DUF222/HNH endonuclease